MVSSIGNADSSMLQQLMLQMQQKMKSADTDGTAGLSKTELSSVNAGSDQGGSNFLKSLTDQFDSLDTDGNGQLTATEISAAKPPKGPMGPPPGMDIEGSEKTDSTSSTSSTGSTSSTDSTSSDTIEALLEKLMAKVLEEISNNSKKIESGDSSTETGQNKVDSLTTSADTDGTTGLSKTELSAVDTSSDTGKANFVNNLIKNFDSIDADGNGQLSGSEMAAAKPNATAQAASANSANSSLNSLGNSLSTISSSFVQKLLSSYQNGGISSLASSINLAG